MNFENLNIDDSVFLKSEYMADNIRRVGRVVGLPKPEKHCAWVSVIWTIDGRQTDRMAYLPSELKKLDRDETIMHVLASI